MQLIKPSLARTYFRKAAIIVLAISLVILAWTSVIFRTDINANAATLDGVGDRVEGTVDTYVGKAKRFKGDLTDDYREEMEGSLQEAKGKLEQNIGVAKNNLDDAKDSVEDRSESLIDAVKDFLD